MKIHSGIPRKILKRSHDCVDGELVNIFALTPALHTGEEQWYLATLADIGTFFVLLSC